MQHFLRAAQRNAEDRAGAVRTAEVGRSVERAVYFNEGPLRVGAIGRTCKSCCTIRSTPPAVILKIVPQPPSEPAKQYLPPYCVVP